jgi:hypothetical protein
VGLKGGGVKGNAGGRGVKGNAGGGVKGNAGGRGVKGNAGNGLKGKTKKKAGARSGLKRKTHHLLIVKNPWLDMILTRKKVWEIRGTKTAKRGLIHLGLSGSQGQIRGRVGLTDCLPLSRYQLGAHVDKHCIRDLESIKYQKIYAWVLKDVQVYKPPLRYTHVRGAITWIKL